MRNISDKSCTEIETNFLCSKTIFPEIRAVYEIIWKNEFVILIAFPG
jgi:hypothetical protein